MLIQSEIGKDARIGTSGAGTRAPMVDKEIDGDVPHAPLV